MRKIIALVSLFILCCLPIGNARATAASISNPSFEDNTGWVFSNTGTYWSYEFSEKWFTNGTKSLTLYVPGSVSGLYPGANTYAQVSEEVDLTGINEIRFDLETYGTWNDPGSGADYYHSFEMLVDGNPVYTLERQENIFLGQKAQVSGYDGTHTLTIRMSGHADFASAYDRGVYVDNLRIVSSHVVLPIVFAKPNPCTRVATLTAPANGSHLTTLIPVIQWTNPTAGLETNLTLEISRDSSFPPGWIAYSPIIPGIQSWKFSENLLPAITYYWRIQYSCANYTYYAPYSEIWSFTTGSGGVIPAAPILISPANNSSVSGTSVTLQWKPVAGAVDYGIWYQGNQGRNFRRSTGTSTTISGLFPSTTYSWWVTARNNYAFSSASIIWKFTTGANASGPTDIFGMQELSIPKIGMDRDGVWINYDD